MSEELTLTLTTNGLTRLIDTVRNIHGDTTSENKIDKVSVFTVVTVNYRKTLRVPSKLTFKPKLFDQNYVHDRGTHMRCRSTRLNNNNNCTAVTGCSCV